ncbi:MAG: hypothetical protein FWG50_07115 [Kiritimatiellaeota bacterium]|nr:hypothetical protein [Kiritimatiellota bacterium]
MRLLMRLLPAALLVAGNAAHAQTRLSTSTPGTSLRAGKSGVSVAPQDVRREIEKKPAETVVTKMVFSGPPTGWGIVKADAPCYSAEGKRLSNAPAGTVFTYSSVKNSSKNMVLEAKVEHNGAWKGPVFIDIADAIIFSGTLDEMPKDLLADVQAYFSVKSKIAQRRQAIEEAEYAKNPHYLSAKTTREKYLESMKSAEVLNAQAEKQVGLAKNKTLDQLRALKYEQTKLKDAADKEAAAYKKWKEANPVNSDAFAADKELAALEKQMQDLSAKVTHVLPNE